MINVSQFSLEGKIALITGGSRGIGEAAALGFAKAGADVAVASRKMPELERVADEVEKLGRKALPVEANIGRMEEIQPLVDKVVKEFGKIDILVNNAGTALFATCMDMTEKIWDVVMNLDLKGLFFLSGAAARVMKETGGGSIINVSSVLGFRVEFPTTHYSIAKAGVIMATKVMALEWAPYKIRVNAVAPGAIETRLLNAAFSVLPPEAAKEMKDDKAYKVPMGRFGEPREIADVMIFLASNAASYMTGHTVVVDGGDLLT